MWNRKELKERAKAAFKANYWRCVLVAFIMAALIGGGAFSSGSRVKGTVDELRDASAESYGGSDEFDPAQLDELPPEVAQFAALEDMGMDDLTPAQLQQMTGAPAPTSASLSDAALLPILAVVGGAFALIALAASAVDILLLNPLTVSFAHFFTKNTRAPAELDALARGFTPSWKHNVGTMFLRDLFIWLWALLLVVPGIVKAYAYRMVPYIMAEHPELKGTEAITLSRRMMNGNKWRTFVFDLSFLGWELLSGLTAGILGVFWVRPYKAAANAELYRAVSGAFFGDGGAYAPETPEIE